MNWGWRGGLVTALLLRCSGGRDGGCDGAWFIGFLVGGTGTAQRVMGMGSTRRGGTDG